MREIEKSPAGTDGKETTSKKEVDSAQLVADILYIRLKEDQTLTKETENTGSCITPQQENRKDKIN